MKQQPLQPKEISIYRLMDAIHFKIIKELGKNDLILQEIQDIQQKIKSKILPDYFLTEDDFRNHCETWASEPSAALMKRISMLSPEMRKNLAYGRVRIIDTTIEGLANKKLILSEPFLLCGISILSDTVKKVSVSVHTSEALTIEDIFVTTSEAEQTVYYGLVSPKLAADGESVIVTTEDNVEHPVILKGAVLRTIY